MINIFACYAYLGAWTVSTALNNGALLMLEMSESRGKRSRGVVSK
jgi:hypothetical protein